jgi:hypothetical protein
MYRTPSAPCSLTFFSSRYSWNVEQAAAGKYLVELVLLELVHARAAGDENLE